MPPVAARSVSPDPLLADVELSERATFYPLGFPVEIESNTTDLIEAAAHCWGMFSQEVDERPIRISIGVANEDGGDLPPHSRFFARGHLMSIIADPRNFAVCDFSSHVAFGWITRDVARNHRLAGYRFLIAPGMSLLQSRHLAPVHGALVASDGRGVVLCGESCAGKSTLAYACARAGWTYVSDDGTFLLRDQHGCWGVGNPYTLHLREGARELFPELASRMSSIRPGGKIGMEIATLELPISLATRSSIEHVVFLHRQTGGPARVEQCDGGDAVAWCERFASFGEDRVREAQRRSYQRLLAARVWRMYYDNLDSAIGQLEQLI